MDVSDLVSRFIIARFLLYNVRDPRIFRVRARAPYTVYRYGDFILITFPSCFLSKAEQILFSIELVNIIVLGELLLCIQSFI